MDAATRWERNASDQTVPIHTGCSSRDDLSVYATGFI